MYSYDNYKAVKDGIEKKRLDAIGESDRRSARLAYESEEIRKIDEELSGTGLLLFKTACSGGDITPIRERNQALVKRRRELIVSLGYPEDYTDVHYSCKKCSDTGFIDGVKMCSCFREGLIKATIASSGMGKLLEKQSFDNFDLSLYDESCRDKMAKTLELAKEYVRTFGKGGGNLVLAGKTGTGKTHISSAIAKEIIERGYDVIYDSAQNIVSDFESDKFRSGYKSEEPKGEKYLECDLLIIDDLGTEFSSAFTVSCLYNLLNTRQNKGLSTIISTNLSPEELASKYEDRIYSRIIGSAARILSFVGRDLRIHGTKK